MTNIEIAKELREFADYLKESIYRNRIDALLAAADTVEKADKQEKELEVCGNEKLDLVCQRDGLEATLRQDRGLEYFSVIAERDTLTGQVSGLVKKNYELAQAVAFFASVIKSGEPWTQTCEDTLAKALAAPIKEQALPTVGCASFRQWKAGVAQAIANEKAQTAILPNEETK